MLAKTSFVADVQSWERRQTGLVRRLWRFPRTTAWHAWFMMARSDFIITHDIKYRLGRDPESEELTAT